MANKNYTEVSNQLESLFKSSPRNSEIQNIRAYKKAVELVSNSNLSQDEQNTVLSAIKSTPVEN